MGMPNIEFECTKCGAKFTMQRYMYEPDADVRCPKCGTRHPRRVLNSLKSKLLYYLSPGAQADASSSSCAACGI